MNNKLLNQIKKLDKKLKDNNIAILDEIKSINKTDLKSFLINIEKNAIIFNCQKINDDINYILSLNINMMKLDPKKTLHFISFSEFIPSNIVLFLHMLSEKHKIVIYVDNFDEYNELKKISSVNFKIKTFEDAEKLELITRRQSGSCN